MVRAFAALHFWELNSLASNALAGKVVCGRVIDEDGIEKRSCAYIPDFEDARGYAFRAAFSLANRPETGYQFYLPFFEETDVSGCQDARDYVERSGTYFFFGFGCLTPEELESLRTEIYNQLNQLKADICPAYRSGERSVSYLLFSVQVVATGACAIPGILLTAKNKFIGGLISVMGGALCYGITEYELEKILDENCD